MSSTLLGTLQIAALPTYDPMVARIVGHSLARKPSVTLHGTRNGQDDITITYQKAADGSVKAEGHIGTMDVHEVYAPVKDPGSLPTKLFGVAGQTQTSDTAVAHGPVGSATDVVSFSLERSTSDVPLTDALRVRGALQTTVRQFIKVLPIFGGAPAMVNLFPGSGTQETQPLQSQDTLRAGGKVDSAALQRQLKWNTTSWSRIHNDREGNGISDIFMVEDASEEITIERGDEQTITQDPIRYVITDDAVGSRAQPSVVADGTLVTSSPGHATISTPYHREYRYGDKGVAVSETIGDTTLNFSIG